MASAVGVPRKKIVRSKDNLLLASRAKTLLANAKQHRQTSRETHWRQSENQYRGVTFSDMGELVSGDQVNVNMSFSTVNTIVPYVTGSDPQFIVEPYSGDATPDNAALQEALLNRQWRSNRLSGNEHLKRAAWDYIIYGDGYMKTSYTMFTKFKRDTIVPAEVAELWVDRLDPRDVWLDPGSDGIHNARWCIIRFYKSVEELQGDKRYHRTAELAGSADVEEDDPRRQGDHLNRTDHPRDQLVPVYEFYDIIAKQLIVFCDQSDLPLQIVDDIDTPVVQMSNYPIPNCPYHMGELEQIRVLQQELDKTRTQMVQHRKRNAQKWIARAGILDTAAKAALASEEVNAVVEILADDRMLSDILAPLQLQPLLADVYAVDQTIKGDMYEVTGVNEYLRGASPSIRKSATEATIMEGASNIKTSHKLRQIERAVRLIGQSLLNTAAEVFPLTDSEEMTMMLSGREAQRAVANDSSNPSNGQDVTSAQLVPGADMFVGTYEVFVEQGSTELRNPVVKEQKYREMYTILCNTQPILMQMGVGVDMRKVLELWLDSAGVDNVDAILSVAASPMPQAAAPGGLPAMDPTATGGLMPPTGLGDPNMMGAMPPEGMIGPGNSGMMPPIS
jgi:hypothetical protein